MQDYKHLTKKEKKIFNEIKLKKNYFEDSTKDKRLEWEEAWKLLTQYVDKNKNPFNSSKRLPLARRTIDTLAAFVVAREPSFNALPVGEGDDIKAQFIKELLQYQAKQKGILNLKEEAKIGVKGAAAFGTAIWKVYWCTKLGKNKEVLFDDPQLENKNIMDIFADPYIRDVQRQDYVIERFELSMNELRKNPSYKVPADMKPSYTDTETTHYDSSRLNEYDLNTNQGGEDVQNKVEVWEAWSKEKVYTIADPEGQPVFLREMDNPYGFIPYVKMVYELDAIPNRFYGIGAIGPNVKINKGIDELVNNIIENIRLIINPMYKRKRGANVDPRQFITKPGGFIDVDDNDDIEQLRTTDTTASGYQLLQLLQGEFQRGTAVSNVRMGAGGGADTATEAEIQQSNADTQTNAIKDNFEQAISEIGRMVAQLNVQMMDRTHSIRIFNTELIEKLNQGITEMVLSPEEIQEVEQTGMLHGFILKPEEVQEIMETGKMSGQELDEETKDKIRKFGKIIRFGKDAIDVAVDVEVEADSTLNQNSSVLRKQLMDFLNTANRFGVGVDWNTVGKEFTELSGIPNASKFILTGTDAPPPPEGMGYDPEGKLVPMQNLQASLPQGNVPPGPAPGTVPPQVGQLNSEQAIMQSIRQ